MLIRTPAIICAIRPHAEHGAVVRAMTPDHGLLAGYVRGARSRVLRPVLMPANLVQAEFRWRTPDQLASLTAELVESRAPLMAEPLAAAAFDWATALTASALPESHAYPALYEALDGVLAAIVAAPAARGWALALIRYEILLLRTLGYGGGDIELPAPDADWAQLHALYGARRAPMAAHVFDDRRAAILAARDRLVDRMKRAVA
jgi:DNA repair protein RecO (recombination protein O)